MSVMFANTRTPAASNSGNIIEIKVFYFIFFKLLLKYLGWPYNS